MISHQDFVYNKFFGSYVRIIEQAKLRTYSGYTERHHILPSSMGGSDDPSNLVDVSAREHFVLHCLLTRCTTGASRHKMIGAFQMMGCNGETHERCMNSRLFEKNRIAFREAMKFHQAGEKNSGFGKFWFTNSITLVSKKFSLNDINELIEQGWVKGRSQEFKENAKIGSFKSKAKMNGSAWREKIRNLPTDQILGSDIKIHRNGEILTVKEFWFFEDYCHSGWKTLGLRAIRGCVWLHQGSYRVSVNPSVAEELLKSGKWKKGTGIVPVHRGPNGLYEKLERATGSDPAYPGLEGQT